VVALKAIRELIVRMVTDNARFGARRKNPLRGD
jgi:hypothetical protein